jgi:hypothetical protein
MALLILSRASVEQRPYGEWLERASEEILVLAKDSPQHEFATRSISYLEWFKNYDSSPLLEMRAEELSRRFPISHVIAAAETDLIRAARMRERLGLSGQSVESAVAFRNKVVMKTLLQARGVSVPRFQAVESVLDVLSFWKEQSAPIVVKPRLGYGSIGVEILRSHADLVRLAEKGASFENTEVEEFVEGELYHIDGLFVNGTIVFAWPSRYLKGSMAHPSSLYNGSLMLAPENPLTSRLTEFCLSVLRALPTPPATTFHAEVFVKADGQMVLCEIASRTAGVGIRIMLDYAFGFDVNRAWLQAQCGLVPDGLPDRSQFPLRPRRLCGCFRVHRSAGLNAPPSRLPPWPWVGFTKTTPSAAIGDSAALDVLAIYWFEAATEEELLDRATQIEAWAASPGSG